LGGREDEHIGNDYMGRACSAEEDKIGYVVRSQGLQTFIDFASAFGIAAEAYQRELRLHKPGVNVDDANIGAIELNAECFREGSDGVFGGTINVAVRIDFAPSDRSDVDHHTFAAGDHVG